MKTSLEAVLRDRRERLEQEEAGLVMDHPPATLLTCECGKDYPHIHLIKKNDNA